MQDLLMRAQIFPLKSSSSGKWKCHTIRDQLRFYCIMYHLRGKPSCCYVLGNRSAAIANSAHPYSWPQRNAYRCEKPVCGKQRPAK